MPLPYCPPHHDAIGPVGDSAKQIRVDPADLCVYGTNPLQPVALIGDGPAAGQRHADHAMPGVVLIGSRVGDPERRLVHLSNVAVDVVGPTRRLARDLSIFRPKIVSFRLRI